MFNIISTLYSVYNDLKQHMILHKYFIDIKNVFKIHFSTALNTLQCITFQCTRNFGNAENEHKSHYRE